MTKRHQFGIALVCLLIISVSTDALISADKEESKTAAGNDWSPRRPGESEIPSVVSRKSSSPAKNETKTATNASSTTAADEKNTAGKESERTQVTDRASSAAKVASQASEKQRGESPYDRTDIAQLAAPQTWTVPPQQCLTPYPNAAPQRNCFGLGGAWVRGEYLMWWTDGMQVPALVTAGGTGVLGQPGTTTLFGNEELNTDWRSGGRLSAGFWLTPTQSTGIEANVFALDQETTTFRDSRDAPAFLARPFFNIQTPGEDARLVPGAGFTTGGISIQADTDLQGGEFLLRQLVSQNAPFPTAILVGYRYTRLEDSLVINETQLGPGPVTVSLSDSFNTKNTFHGVDLGVISELRRNRWSLELVGKLALGIMSYDVSINGGRTTAAPPAAPVSTVGGFLAQSTNIGNYEDDDFAVIPELGATLGFNITERLKATAGYTFLYISRVVRAGDQIDRDLNLPLVPGPTTLRPEFSFQPTDFWAQGVNLGLEYNF